LWPPTHSQKTRMDGARCVCAGFEVGKSKFLDRFLGAKSQPSGTSESSSRNRRTLQCVTDSRTNRLAWRADPTLCLPHGTFGRGQNAVCLVNRSRTSGQRDPVRLLRLGRPASSSRILEANPGYLGTPFLCRPFRKRARNEDPIMPRQVQDRQTEPRQGKWNHAIH